MLFEVKDFTRGFQISEEEILKTKLNIIHEETHYNRLPSVKPYMDHHGSENPKMLLSPLFPFWFLSPVVPLVGTLCGGGVMCG